MSHDECKTFNICYVCISDDIFFKKLFKLVTTDARKFSLPIFPDDM